MNELFKQIILFISAATLFACNSGDNATTITPKVHLGLCDGSLGDECDSLNGNILSLNKGNAPGMGDASAATGSYFGMEAMGPGGWIYVNIEGNDGLVIGTEQAASGSHGGAPNDSETPGIDNPWMFFGNTGMHFSALPVNILENDDAGNVTLDMSGWTVTWNGIDKIPMGGCQYGDAANNGGFGGCDMNKDGEDDLVDTAKATVTCDNTCEIGDTYILKYEAHVPAGDPSNFGGVSYMLHLEGTIFDSTSCIEGFDDCDVCNGGNEDKDCAGVCFGDAVSDNCDVCDNDLENDCVQDCNDVWGGDAYTDDCDVCDNDSENDCVQDCEDVWGGDAAEDNCGVCDSDASNDCVQDCNGNWDGDAVLDNCGVCDNNPTNDCIEDCNGVFNGDAALDNCGVCDNDASNNCVQDCNGVWGGDAVLDNCGVCDNNPNNDCVEDCNGVSGGNATEDNCGVCDNNSSNDCEKDCNGVWGGDAALDNCGVCNGGNVDIDCAGICFGDAALDNCDVCDNDSTNDCVKDCNGVYNGDAIEDNCGVCDNDPTNDCVKDCNGVYNGDAILDNCDVCDNDSTNDCVKDCNNVWGGDAALDNCGVCNGGNEDKDCADVCFGNSVEDNCGVCDDDSTNDNTTCENPDDDTTDNADENIAPLANAFAQEVYPSYSISNLNDGNTETVWYSKYVYSNRAVWLQLEWDKIYSVTSIDIDWAAYYNAQEFDVWAKRDGTWEKIGEYSTESSNSVVELNIDTDSIWILLRNHAYSYYGVKEIEVMGHSIEDTDTDDTDDTDDDTTVESYENITSLATAAAEETYPSTSFSESYLNDENSSTRWFSNGFYYYRDVWVMLEWDTTYNISSVEIDWVEDYNATEFDFWAKKDGQWTKVGEFTSDSSNSIVELDFETNAIFVLLKSGTNYYYGINDITVMGCSSENCQ